MNTIAFRQQLKADASHTIHVSIPAEMGDEVEVFVFPRGTVSKDIPMESLAMASLIDESGFARNILNSTEEDCWNDL